jgi:hypothetical protein
MNTPEQFRTGPRDRGSEKVDQYLHGSYKPKPFNPRLALAAFGIEARFTKELPNSTITKFIGDSNPDMAFQEAVVKHAAGWNAGHMEIPPKGKKQGHIAAVLETNTGMAIFDPNDAGLVPGKLPSYAALNFPKNRIGQAQMRSMQPAGNKRKWQNDTSIEMRPLQQVQTKLHADGTGEGRCIEYSCAIQALWGMARRAKPDLDTATFAKTIDTVGAEGTFHAGLYAYNRKKISFSGQNPAFITEPEP